MTDPAHNMTDDEETIRNFRLESPEHFNVAREVFGLWPKDAGKLGMPMQHWRNQ